MRNVGMNLVIDRHLTNGTAFIRGEVGGRRVDVRIDRGVDDGNAYVKGQVGQDGVNITFTRSAQEGYESAKGVYGTTKLDSDIRRSMPDGDTDISSFGAHLIIDRQSYGQHVELRAPDFRGSIGRQYPDGDERGYLSVRDDQMSYSLDRDERSGGFLLSGTTQAGVFRLEGVRHGRDGDLSLKGSVPEGLQMFPVLWEILGDDKNVPDRNPEYFGNVMGMSTFLQQRGVSI